MPQTVQNIQISFDMENDEIHRRIQTNRNRLRR